VRAKYRVERRGCGELGLALYLRACAASELVPARVKASAKHREGSSWRLIQSPNDACVLLCHAALSRSTCHASCRFPHVDMAVTASFKLSPSGVIE
jgi:hypothetical protein